MTAPTTWMTAQKAPFHAFGILYYPLFHNHADLPTTLSDEDMAWAVTANANLEGTGYTLSQPSILTLAACHRALTDLSIGSTFLPFAEDLAAQLNPLADLQRLVPEVSAAPMYPDFPTQVMEMDEAQFRYDQQRHYLSTYGAELVAGLLGLDVTVGEGWMPDATATPKTRADEALVAPKVLHVLVTVEDLASVVSARFARATRMHPAEIATALLVFADLGDGSAPMSFPKIAFHENMMELVRMAARKDSATLERVCHGLAQHPGDLLKAVMYVLEADRTKHLTTRQKKGFCRAFERFSVRSIAQNIVDADRTTRLAVNYLSVARFGGPKLREAVQLVETRQIRSWTGTLELLWNKVLHAVTPTEQREELWQQLTKGHESHADALSELKGRFDALYDDIYDVEPEEPLEVLWQQLLAHYGQRPGILLRSLGRLIKAGCPFDLLEAEATAHADSYALPTLVRTLTLFSSDDRLKMTMHSWAGFAIGESKDNRDTLSPELREGLCSILRSLVHARMRGLDTPLRGKRVFLDVAGVSLVGSVLIPNETGNTNTAWPPVGIAYDLPTDKTVRFFTFWDERRTRVDIDLHFVGMKTTGEQVHVGWNAGFRANGLVTSGDITTSHNSVEYLDADMAAATSAGVGFVVQEQHIFSGVRNWGDISTCYSGALVVGDIAPDVALYDMKNLLFRDDLTGEGHTMNYAVVNFPHHYVRILRGANVPLGHVGFSLGSYLEALFEAQEVTLVDTPEEAELRACVGRSDDPQVISLFDEGFYLG